VREIEEAHGAGAVTLHFADGSSRGFNLRRNDRLEVLLSAFRIAAGDLDKNPQAIPEAIELARMFGRAERVVPPERLWDTVTALVRDAENYADSAPGPGSDSFSEAKE
jgi:hypothetical protein